MGQNVSLTAFASQMRLWEQRHDYTAGHGGGPRTAKLHGRLLEIRWHSAIEEQFNETARQRVAYRPAVSCDTTDEISEQDLAAFEFIISTDDEPPPLDTVSTGVERVDRVDVYLDFDLEDEERAPGPLVCPSDSP